MVILHNYGKIRNNNLVSFLLDLYNLHCFDSLLSILSILSLYFMILNDHNSIYFIHILFSLGYSSFFLFYTYTFFPGVFSQANVLFP